MYLQVKMWTISCVIRIQSTPSMLSPFAVKLYAVFAIVLWKGGQIWPIFKVDLLQLKVFNSIRHSLALSFWYIQKKIFEFCHNFDFQEFLWRKSHKCTDWKCDSTNMSGADHAWIWNSLWLTFHLQMTFIYQFLKVNRF